MVVQLDEMPVTADRVLDQSLAETDPAVFAAIEAELDRQQTTLEMIASENFAPIAVMQAQGSVLTNKYAEGYPGRRYYGGCEHVDVIEQLAIDRVKELFGAEYANVQPHSGAQANAAAMAALLKPGDTILGLDLAHGGHLTHGMRLNFSGQLYKVAAYHVRQDDHLVDMAEVERLAQEHRPQLIIAGWSAYPRQLDFAEFRRIADSVGAYLMVDMAHFAGLVAAGLHPSPVPHAHVVTSTTHKTLGGPRGGIILATADLAKKFNSAVFPGQQGGPLEHVIAGKAVSFKLAAEPAFRERQERTLAGARLLADRLLADDARESRDQRDQRRHRRTPGAGRPARLGAGRQTGRGPAAFDRHHRQPQRRAVRPAAADGQLRSPHRHAGAGRPRFRCRRFRRGRRHHRHRTASRAVRPATGGSAVPGHPARAEPPAVPGTVEGRIDEPPAAPPAPTCRTTRTSCGATRNLNVPTTWSSSAAAGTAWPLPTTWPRTTASPTSRCWRRGGSAGGNMARNTTLIRSNYLWDESATIYEHSLKLWEGLEEDLGYPILFSQRGVLNLAHTLQDVRDSVRRVEANKLNGIDAEWVGPEDVKRLCPIVNTSTDIRYPVLGATYQPRGGIAKHDYVAWGFARRASEARHRPDPGL